MHGNHLCSERAMFICEGGEGMRVNPRVSDMVEKILDGHLLTRDEILFLLEIPLHSHDAGRA